MIFKELVDKFNWEDIKIRLFELYPNEKKNINGYESALQELKETKPSKRVGGMTILVEILKDDDFGGDGEEYASVGGIKHNERWAIDLTSWRDWLAMKIDGQTIEDFSEIDIFCHCLWELTWHGYTNKEVKDTMAELMTTVKSIKTDKEIKGIK